MAHSNEEWVRLGDGSLITEDADVGLGHIVPVSTYTKVYLSLIFLTVLTVVAATQDFGAFNLFIAILIATVKAAIVTLVFMHLKFERFMIWVVVVYPIFILLLLIVGTLGDRSVKEKIIPQTSIVDYAVPIPPPSVDLHHEEGGANNAHGSSKLEESASH